MKNNKIFLMIGFLVPFVSFAYLTKEQITNTLKNHVLPNDIRRQVDYFLHRHPKLKEEITSLRKDSVTVSWTDAYTVGVVKGFNPNTHVFLPRRRTVKKPSRNISDITITVDPFSNETYVIRAKRSEWPTYPQGLSPVFVRDLLERAIKNKKDKNLDKIRVPKMYIYHIPGQPAVFESGGTNFENFNDNNYLLLQQKVGELKDDTLYSDIAKVRNIIEKMNLGTTTSGSISAIRNRVEEIINSMALSGDIKSHVLNKLSVGGYQKITGGGTVTSVWDMLLQIMHDVSLVPLLHPAFLIKESDLNNIANALEQEGSILKNKSAIDTINTVAEKVGFKKEYITLLLDIRHDLFYAIIEAGLWGNIQNGVVITDEDLDGSPEFALTNLEMASVAGEWRDTKTSENFPNFINALGKDDWADRFNRAYDGLKEMRKLIKEMS